MPKDITHIAGFGVVREDTMICHIDYHRGLLRIALNDLMEHIVRVEDTIGILANCLILAPILEGRREVFGFESGKITRVTLFARGVRTHQMHEFKEFFLGK